MLFYQKQSPYKFFRYISIVLLFSVFVSPIFTRENEGALSGLPVRSSGKVGNIMKRGTIRIGLQKDYRPFHIADPRPGFPGIDIELSEALADAMNVKVEYHYFDLKNLISATIKGEVDIALGGVSANLYRAQYVNFTDPYLITTPAALLNNRVLPPVSESTDYPAKKFDSLSDLKDLGRLTIGVKSGTTNEKLLTEDAEFRFHTIRSYPDRESLLQAIKDGDIDVLVADGVYIQALILEQPQLRTRLVPLLKTYRQEHVSIVVAPGDMETLNYINFFIKEMHRTGYMDKINSRYSSSNDWIPGN